MQRVTGLFSGRGANYSKSLFEEDQDERQEIHQRPSSTSPRQEAAAPVTSTGAWDQAATIRAQLEAELKREQVSRSPNDGRASPPQRSRVPLEPRLSAGSTGGWSSADEHSPGLPGFGAEGFGAEGQGDGAFKHHKSEKPRKQNKRRGKDDAGQFDFNWDAGPGSFAWPAATPAPVTTAQTSDQRPSYPKEKVSPWGADLPSSASVSPEKLPAGAPGRQTSPQSSTFEESIEVEVRAEPDSAPISSPQLASPLGPPSPSDKEQAFPEPLTGLFDEAILAALVAMPQQALVDFLRRLALRRPAEVALALEPATRSFATPAKSGVAPATPEPATHSYADIGEASQHDSPESDAGLAGPTPQEGQPPSLRERASEAAGRSVHGVEHTAAKAVLGVEHAADTAAHSLTSLAKGLLHSAEEAVGASPVDAVSSESPSPPPAITSTTADTPWPPAPASAATGGAAVGAASSQGSLWPPAAPVGSIWSTAAPAVQAAAPAGPASQNPASTIWPNLGPVVDRHASSAGAPTASLWPPAAQKTEWP